MRGYLATAVYSGVLALASLATAIACVTGSPTPTAATATVTPHPRLEDKVQIYYGTMQQTIGKDLEYQGKLYPGIYFTFNLKDAPRGYFVVDTNNRCTTQDMLLRVLDESSRNGLVIGFWAEQLTPAVLKLESCPVTIPEQRVPLTGLTF